MRDRCSALEFRLWVDEFRARPWGDLTHQAQRGELLAMHYNIHRPKDAPALAGAAFMPGEPATPAADTPPTDAELLQEFQRMGYGDVRLPGS